MSGTDAVTYSRERPGMSAFAREGASSTTPIPLVLRGLDGLWGMYQWLDRAPEGRNETGVWWRRHDEYDTLSDGAAFFGVQTLRFAASGGDDRLVRVHLSDGRDADAGCLDDVVDSSANGVVYSFAGPL